jgi:hypothetical protein
MNVAAQGKRMGQFGADLWRIWAEIVREGGAADARALGMPAAGLLPTPDMREGFYL